MSGVETPPRGGLDTKLFHELMNLVQGLKAEVADLRAQSARTEQELSTLRATVSQSVSPSHPLPQNPATFSVTNPNISSSFPHAGSSAPPPATTPPYTPPPFHLHPGGLNIRVEETPPVSTSLLPPYMPTKTGRVKLQPLPILGGEKGQLPYTTWCIHARAVIAAARAEFLLTSPCPADTSTPQALWYLDADPVVYAALLTAVKDTSLLSEKVQRYQGTLSASYFAWRCIKDHFIKLGRNNLPYLEG
jgi:hypothetical protein